MFTRVDDRLHDHPKFLKCSLSARGLWITALSWVGDKLTDGFVPHSCLGRLGARKRDADRLVEAGLWERGECDGEPGYWFHDFEDWNKAATHAEVRKRAGQNRSRVLKHRVRRSVVYKQRTPQPVVTGTTPADWSTPEDPRCRDHAKLPREHVPACRACGQARQWFAKQAMAEKQARHDAIASCEYCDDRGLATTQDAAGNDVLIRCPHSGPLPIIPAPEPVVHNPPPPEVRAWFDRQHSTRQPVVVHSVSME